MTEIEVVPHEILCEPFEQFGMTGGEVAAEIVCGLDQSQAQIALEQAVHDAFREAWIERIDQHLRHAMEAMVEIGWNLQAHAIEFERKFCRDALTGPGLAADEFEICGCEHPSKGREARLRPFLVEEMAVAARTLHSGSEEDLAHIGCTLKCFLMGLILDVAADDMPSVGRIFFGLPVAGQRGVDELSDEQIEGLIGREAIEDPLSMVASGSDAAVDVCGGASERIFPERGPVRGVIVGAREQALNEQGSLVGCGIGNKRLSFLEGRNETGEVEIHAACEGGVVAEGGRHLRLEELGLAPFRTNKGIDGISRTGWRRLIR